MGRKGNGYGSEWHFDRYRRMLPDVLDEEIKRSIRKPLTSITWIYPGESLLAKEPRGLAFLEVDPSAHRHWKYGENSGPAQEIRQMGRRGKRSDYRGVAIV